MLDALRRLLAKPAAATTQVHPDVGAPLAAHAALPEGLAMSDATAPVVQIDGDPAPGRPVVESAPPTAPRDAFVVPGGLGLPAIALVNVREGGQARVALWTLDAPSHGGVSVFAQQRQVRLPAAEAIVGWQASQVVVLPRLQCLVVLRHDDVPRTARVAVLDLASGALRLLGVAEPDPFERTVVHVAALHAGADGVLVRWHAGRVPLGHWGDVAREDRIVLFTPSERDGLEVLRLALDDGNVRAWGLQDTTLWLHAIDGRLRPQPRLFTWSLDLFRVL